MTKQLVHCFSVNIRMSQTSKVMFTWALPWLTSLFPVWQILMLTLKECINCILVSFFFVMTQVSWGCCPAYTKYFNAITYTGFIREKSKIFMEQFSSPIFLFFSHIVILKNVKALITTIFVLYLKTWIFLCFLWYPCEIFFHIIHIILFECMETLCRWTIWMLQTLLRR